MATTTETQIRAGEWTEGVAKYLLMERLKYGGILKFLTPRERRDQAFIESIESVFASLYDARGDASHIGDRGLLERVKAVLESLRDDVAKPKSRELRELVVGVLEVRCECDDEIVDKMYDEFYKSKEVDALREIVVMVLNKLIANAAHAR